MVVPRGEKQRLLRCGLSDMVLLHVSELRLSLQLLLLSLLQGRSLLFLACSDEHLRAVHESVEVALDVFLFVSGEVRPASDEIVVSSGR